MNTKYPIYTKKTECQDCYKCVRHCPVKAITVINDSAIVDSELCVYCGKCVDICPVNAKKIRNDIIRAKQLIKLKKKVIVSLAPSYVTEFEINDSDLIYALKKLGFYGVSETALGAAIVSEDIKTRAPKSTETQISTACPTVVETIVKYYPELTGLLSSILSPLCTHAKLLKKYYGSNCGIIFIGPCISKKLESDKRPDLVDLTLTFEELKEWLKEENIPLNKTQKHESFIPFETADAALYPIDGGMISTIKKDADLVDAEFMCFSGLKNIIDILSNFTDEKDSNFSFLELLSCKGGCINGPATIKNKSIFKKRSHIIQNYKDNRQKNPVKLEKINIDIPYYQNSKVINDDYFKQQEISSALKSIGKFSADDELNCGGCGYNSCKDFVKALILSKAEKQMCVVRMRKIAQKKINALIKSIPMGIVIIDDKLKIIDTNKMFLKIFAGIDFEPDENFYHSVEGQDIKKFIPLEEFYTKIKKGNRQLIEQKVYFKDKIFNTVFFNIEESNLMGAVFQDITFVSVKRETVIKKAEEVINKNLQSVQQIASLLGENAAETEIILNSLVDAFHSPKMEVK